MTGDIALSDGWRSRVACPACGSAIDRHSRANQAKCTACTALYPVSPAGVINFGVEDEFYDVHGFTSTGRDFTRSPPGRVGLYLARSHFLYDISRAVPAGASVVEIGCGGGSRYLASRYDMLGVELSTAAADCASNVYGAVVQASVEQLPLRDASADALVSSFVLEHLGPDIVDDCLAEMSRVLKPGARMLHFFDLETNGSFGGWAKQQPWYQSVFIDSKGHYGMRTRSDWEGLFTKTGFSVTEQRLSRKSWLQDLSIWEALNEAAVPAPLRTAGRFAEALRRKGSPVADLAVEAVNDLIDPLLPDAWAAKAILTLEKAS